MAYYQKQMYLIMLWDGKDATKLYRYLVDSDERVPVSGTMVTNGFSLATCYEYDDAIYGYGLPVTNLNAALKVYGDAKAVNVVYVHAQVREKFGFCADTAVPGGTTNTKAFTAKDKYLVLRYLENTGRISAELIQQANDAGYTTFEEYIYKSGNVKLYEKYTLKPSQSDTDLDGIDDGWELYVDSNPLNAADRTSDADGDGVELWREYDKTVEDGKAHATDPYDIDSDGDGVLDAYYHDYMLWDPDGDADGDGLPNYVEYLVTEVFKYAKCRADQYATDGGVCDYFKKVGDLYLGEIFTDHDQMDDETEDALGFSRYVYDAHKDLDDNGWSNYAEYRAVSDESTWIQVGTQSNEVTGVIEPLMGYAGRPTPNVTARIVYNGSQTVEGFVVKAWKDPEMMTAPDAVWTVTASNALTKAGNVWTFVLKTPDTGMLKEGLNVFVVYGVSGDAEGGDNENAGWTAGAPYGFVRDVNVGWNAAAFELEVTDTNPVFARLNLADGSNDRTVIFGSDSGNVETNDGVVASMLSGGRRNHIRVVPYSLSCWAFEQNHTSDPFEPCLKYGMDYRVVAEFDLDSETHPYITEADFIRDGAYDIDWNGFDTTAFANHPGLNAANVQDITAVRYRIVIGADGPLGKDSPTDSKTVERVYSTLIERRF